MVIDRAWFLVGGHTRIFDETAATQDACGQVHIVTGAGKTGAALVAHADVNEVAFT